MIADGNPEHGIIGKERDGNDSTLRTELQGICDEVPEYDLHESRVGNERNGIGNAVLDLDPLFGAAMLKPFKNLDKNCRDIDMFRCGGFLSRLKPGRGKNIFQLKVQLECLIVNHAANIDRLPGVAATAHQLAGET